MPGRFIYHHSYASSFAIASQLFLLTLLRIILVIPLSLCPSPPASNFIHIPFIMFVPCTPCGFIYLLDVSNIHAGTYEMTEHVESEAF
jgi:hypothetical protein